MELLSRDGNCVLISSSWLGRLAESKRDPGPRANPSVETFPRFWGDLGDPHSHPPQRERYRLRAQELLPTPQTPGDAGRSMWRLSPFRAVSPRTGGQFLEPGPIWVYADGFWHLLLASSLCKPPRTFLQMWKLSLKKLSALDRLSLGHSFPLTNLKQLPTSHTAVGNRKRVWNVYKMDSQYLTRGHVK